MNCRDVETQLLKQPDGVLSPEEQTRLEAHLSACPACGAYRAQLAATLQAYRADAIAVAVPNVEGEWAIVRDRLAGAGAVKTRKRPLAPVVWFAAPLAAAAALAFAYFAPSGPATLPLPATATGTEVARAEYVEAGNADASTMVYVDKDSGWLVVWAADTTTKSG